jgi:nickel-dependent lactate racemase
MKARTMRCTLKYGRTGLVVEIPDSWDVTVVSRPPMPAVADPAAAIQDALETPVGAGELSSEARGARAACIMICDLTRPVPNRLILRPLIERLLAAGLPPGAITVLVATGLHRPCPPEEVAEIVGDPWVQEHAVLSNHLARDEAGHVRLGTTAQGVPVAIDRRVVEADVRVAVGLVEPHFMAGWSGGRKLILPGCAHADAIMALHSARMLGHPRAGTCVLDGNPLHLAQREALGMVGRTLAVSVVINDDRQLAFASYGSAEESFSAAVRFAEPLVRVGVPSSFPVVLTGAAGYPLDSTWYQSLKGACAGAPILSPGGDLFLAASCSEGFGSSAFRSAQERLVRLGKERFRAEAAGRDRAEIDEWQTVMLLKALDAGTVHLYSEGLPMSERALTATAPVTDLAASLRSAVERAGSRRVAVIPEGPYAAPFVEAPFVEAKGKQRGIGSVSPG